MTYLSRLNMPEGFRWDFIRLNLDNPEVGALDTYFLVFIFNVKVEAVEVKYVFFHLNSTIV